MDATCSRLQQRIWRPMDHSKPSAASSTQRGWNGSAPTPALEQGVVHCHVMSIDRFGNVQLSAREDDLRRAEVDFVGELDARIGGETFTFTRARRFGDVPEGKPALIQDSSGRLAIVVNGGSAAQDLNLKVGESVEVRRPRR